MKKMIAVLSIAAVSACSVFEAFAEEPAVKGKWWTMNTTNTIGGVHRLREFSAGRFDVWGRRGKAHLKFAQTDILRRVDRDMWTQEMFVFSCRSATGRLIRVTPLVEVSCGKSNRLYRAEKIIWRGNQWRNFSFPLNKLFPLGDTGVKVTRMGFTIDVENWNPGERGWVELKNIRICKEGEVSFSGNVAEDFIKVVSSRPPHRFAARPGALKVFFAFDNEDLVDSVHERSGRRDPQQDGGFRERLLEHLDGTIAWTQRLEDADAIVYSRARADPSLATNIVRAVRERGIPLYAASIVADPEIRAILPCSLEKRDPAGFAPRRRIVAAEKSGLSEGLSTATFGVYRACTAAKDANVLLSFDDGTPALLEGRCGKGRVIYQMTAIGQTLLPGKKAYDAFFARVIGRISGRTIPEAPCSESAFALGDGWFRGIGAGTFGRFGWEIGSGLLVERLGNTFRVSHGDSEYSFRSHADRTALKREMTFDGDSVSPLSFGGKIAVNGRSFARFDGSLAFPGTRWEIYEEHIDMDVSGPLKKIAVPTVSGVVVVDALEGKLPHPSQWSEPWLLMFDGTEKTAPLAVIMSKRPDSAGIIVEDGAPAAVSFRRKGGAGTFVTLWPYGAATVDTSGWAVQGVSSEALGRIRFWCPRAFSYPYALDEKFRVSSDGKRFEIVDTFRYRRTPNDWNIVPEAYASVPPLARLMSDMFSTRDRVEPRFATKFGDFADVAGRESVTWSLPVPRPDLSLLPRTLAFEKYRAMADTQFRHAVKYSCGGRTPLDGRTLAFPRGRHKPTSYNLDMHTMLLGMCRCLPNPYSYDAENRKSMYRRARLREMEPLEVAPYKMAVRYRREPFTGYPYTIYMHSWRNIITSFDPPNLGSTTMYGDSNETVRMILATMQMCADRHGQRDAVIANWETLRRLVPSYTFALDDWLVMCAGCIEDWAVSGIDMLNTEYGTMCSLARLAEIAGDKDLETVALYMAARRAIPTLARFRLPAYFLSRGFVKNREHFAYSDGFGESGPSMHQCRPGRRVCEVDLYDMSQGIPQDLISLYDRYAKRAIRDNYIPVVRAATRKEGFNYIMCAILALGGDVPESEMIEKMEMVAADAGFERFLRSDWPGMDTGSFLEFVFAKYRSTPRITDCRDMDLHDAWYDPASGMFGFEATAGERGVLEIGGKRVEGLVPGVRVRKEFKVK